MTDRPRSAGSRASVQPGDYVVTRVGPEGPVGLVRRVARDGSWADVRWQGYSKRMRTEVLRLLSAGAEGDLPDLEAFAQKVLACAQEGCDADGGDIQEWGLEFGLLERVTVTEPCGERCFCAEWDDFPQECIRRASPLREPDA